MKTKTIEKVVSETIIRENIYCNKCGNSCLGQVGNLNGLIETSICGAYDSEHLQDGSVYTFSLCEKCLRELFETFIHPPEKEDYIYF